MQIGPIARAVRRPVGRAGGRAGRVVRRALRYGSRPSNVADLWLPEEAAGPLPVVVLLHGGYWRGAYTKQLMNGLARDLARRGMAAWNVEYRRTGPLGRGGGWPGTFEDVAAGVDAVRGLEDVDCRSVVLCGHSAGGHLALWAAARRHQAPGALVGHGSGRPLVPAGVVALAGVADLASAATGRGRSAVAALLGPDPSGERLRQVSPMALLPLGVPQVLVHGSADDVLPVSATRRYAAAARAAGDDVIVDVVDGAGHRTVIDPASRAWAVAAGHIERLLGGGGRSGPR